MPHVYGLKPEEEVDFQSRAAIVASRELVEYAADDDVNAVAEELAQGCCSTAATFRAAFATCRRCGDRSDRPCHESVWRRGLFPAFAGRAYVQGRQGGRILTGLPLF